MSATRYRRFLKLCEEWPRDDYKKGRDLGTFLRQRVASAFREGENTQVSQCFVTATEASPVLTFSLGIPISDHSFEDNMFLRDDSCPNVTL